MKNFNKLIQKQFAVMTKTGKLFRVAITGREIWDLYLKSFTNDPIFRDPESTEHNCNNCNNFIRRYGNVIAIDTNLNIITLFDVDAKDEYTEVAKTLSDTIKESKIENVFIETFDSLNSLPYEACKKENPTFKLGIASNVKRYTKEEAEVFGVVKANEIRKFNHFHIELPKAFVDFTGNSIEAIQAIYRDKYSVFKRTMTEIPLDTIKLVKDLINQGSLLDGTTHLNSINEIEKFIFLLDKATVNAEKQDNWFWVEIYDMSERVAKFKNTLIGVLCTELAEGMEINKACENWNKRVDPVNYHKATAPITKSQILEAEKFVAGNGYVQSFMRRMAVLDDIKASEIKHMNVDNDSVKSVSIFDKVQATKSQHKRNEFKNVEEVHIDKFMTDILPGCSSIELFLMNKHKGNLVTLTTADDPDSKNIFRWDNNYSWTFNGNLAGKSQIKEAIKSEGGIVDGVLNFRLAWNDGNGTDNSDLDIWAIEPNNQKIGFSTGYRKGKYPGRSLLSGQLDVDNTNPGGKLAVENITWNNAAKMKDGVYKVYINQYNANNSQGFKVEIEFDEEVYEYTYNRPLKRGQSVEVARVTLKNGEFTIKHILESTESSKTLYGLETNNFHKVNLLCLSPNHWNVNKVGNKHYMFMLEGCKSPNDIRSFHNENLIPALLKHRKVMEVLGATTMIKSTSKQLSGLGFNSTVKDEVIVKLAGNFKRMIKITF